MVVSVVPEIQGTVSSNALASRLGCVLQPAPCGSSWSTHGWFLSTLVFRTTLSSPGALGFAPSKYRPSKLERWLSG